MVNLMMTWAFLTGLLLGGSSQAPAPDAAAAAPSPPAYVHASVTFRQVGKGPRSYWLFEPAEPKPATAPVVVFCHGWVAVNPGIYGAWIEHLARRGSIVIFPRYQEDWTTPPVEFLPNATAAIRDALDVLQTADGHVRPDRMRFVLMGHSAGGNLAALLAASANESGLPAPAAVLAFLPGEVRPVATPTLDKVPATINLVVAACEQDIVVGDARAREIFEGTTAVPKARKLYVLYRSDRSGPVHLVADHLAPCARLAKYNSGEGPFRTIQMSNAAVDLLDRYGFWRVADVTIAASFAGQTLAEATGDGAKFRDLGHWGDGRAVLAPIVDTDLRAIPRVATKRGFAILP